MASQNLLCCDLLGFESKHMLIMPKQLIEL